LKYNDERYLIYVVVWFYCRFAFLIFSFFSWVGGFCVVLTCSMLCLLVLCCVYLFCVYVVYFWLPFGRLTFIYEKYKLYINHYFLYDLFLQTKHVGNLKMIFSFQKAKLVFIWSKWRSMGIICRHSNII
jgi:hypothetical protein